MIRYSKCRICQETIGAADRIGWLHIATYEFRDHLPCPSRVYFSSGGTANIPWKYR